ncbi:unnamed protein product [Symbiodinium natans]|uniref:Pentatricopeptide repeat-containing protein, chloroplastic n=1 Tax=Symbiodinium natans TaxID=878477 RepID=A0A812U5L1_9DINO|nr:unnamed protein product [Symbiodinium natans]
MQEALAALEAGGQLLDLAPARRVLVDVGRWTRSPCVDRPGPVQGADLEKGAPSGVEDPAVGSSLIAHNALISATGKSGAWEWGLLLFHRIPAWDLTPDVVSYNSAIDACSRAEEWQRALLLLGRAGSSQERNLRTYNTAISALGSRWKMALALWSEMSLMLLLPDVITFNACITAFGGAGEWQQALLLGWLLSQRKIPEG